MAQTFSVPGTYLPVENQIIYKFVKFTSTKKGGTPNFFPLLFFVVVGPWIRNGKNPDLDQGSGIIIPDPQHWFTCFFI
jgi:hypothetical protein